MAPDVRLSVPAHPKRLVRELSDAELATLIAIGEVLIPATVPMPAPGQIDDFARWLTRAMLALPHAFGTIVDALGELGPVDKRRYGRWPSAIRRGSRRSRP